MKKFTEELKKQAEPIWQANFEHPFIKGIANGNLALESFRYYVLQDSYYLSHFARIQAIGASRADDLFTTSRMATHSLGTYEAELGLHETFLKQLGVTKQEIAEFIPSPTAYAYTSHLYRVAASGSLSEIIAAILPCYWIYHEIGQLLKESTPNVQIYQEWINAYGGDWFSELVNEQLNRLNVLALESPESEKEKMKQHFIISSQYEFMFWDMAYNQEKWPVAL
ncbi:thiaminase II [Mesobacillus subterraneus]|uniref:thiaminase II n=1 Tax=Mesobacillus subterraneus TaxID=285983 RepID=UPI001CFDA3AF|nr:thiaminase II [Mesobacillus subterraneus]WLR57191.1 thiaminase II [Mesobacillus subterraneus]